ncbi:hypothetical protein NQ318_002580 [Aromia moschata]|uniref:HTH psq-type domain-containing protein n=1 Tax=Aromia moschata TaxID=1265417 RepID=A0AAV8Y766_9CUCU|nr:hypothetical protein NQ318_002580 [Aromia moschata]
MSQLNKKNQQKLKVIEYFKNGMKNKDLSEKYKVHHSAISKNIHNKDKILQHKQTMENTAQIKMYSDIHQFKIVFLRNVHFCGSVRREHTANL